MNEKVLEKFLWSLRRKLKRTQTAIYIYEYRPFNLFLFLFFKFYFMEVCGVTPSLVILQAHGLLFSLLQHAMMVMLHNCRSLLHESFPAYSVL